MNFFFHSTTVLSEPRPPHYRGFTIILRHTTPGTTPLDEWPARRRDLYLTTHTLTTHIHAPGGIRTRNPCTRAAGNEHTQAITNNNFISREEYGFGRTGDIMEMLQLATNGRCLNIMEKFYVYNISRKKEYLNYVTTITFNPIFDILFTYLRVRQMSPLSNLHTDVLLQAQPLFTQWSNQTHALHQPLFLRTSKTPPQSFTLIK
jgi:hypothetical protein